MTTSVKDERDRESWFWFAEKSGSAGEREPRDIEYLKQTGAAIELSLWSRGGSDGSERTVLILDAERFTDFPSAADAAKIVAAPEMYAALEEAVRLMPLGTAKRAAWMERANRALSRARQELEDES